MALQIGIVGLPNVGKSTLFNALTKTKAAQAANYPFCTIDPNVGVVEVPDARLKKLTELVQPKKTIPAAVEFVDIAGLVKGASKGEGLGNAFLSHIREIDAICHVVRFFEGGDIIHVEGNVDPKRDRETIEMELALADLANVKKRMEKLEGKARTGDKQGQIELAALKKIEAALQEGKVATSVALSPEEADLAKHFQLLTQKPVIYAINASEDQIKTLSPDTARAKLTLPAGAQVVIICAKIEEDLQDLSEDEAKEFMKEFSMTTSGLDQLIRAAYAALGYITFFTAGPEEVRAWTVTKGAKGPQAAGVIHTDFERGFICAETIAYDDYVKAGSEAKAKEQGKMRTEGKEYVVKDGDVFHFRFNV
jgi:GTP-binding protein YchF